MEIRIGGAVVRNRDVRGLSGIYAIHNSVTGKSYVGSSIDLGRRLSAHIGKLKRGEHHSIHLQRAWNKYGEDVFSFRVLELAPPETLAEREQHWIHALRAFGNSGYNVCPVASSAIGVARSAEFRAKIAAAMRRRMADPAQRAAVLDSLRRRWDDPNQRRRASERQRGRKMPQQAIEKTRLANKGRVHTPESRRNMSLAHLGKQRGSKHPRAKLTEADVVSIRVRAASGQSKRSIAAHYRISESHVYRICSRRIWTHVA